MGKEVQWWLGRVKWDWLYGSAREASARRGSAQARAIMVSLLGSRDREREVACLVTEKEPSYIRHCTHLSSRTRSTFDSNLSTPIALHYRAITLNFAWSDPSSVLASRYKGIAAFRSV